MDIDNYINNLNADLERQMQELNRSMDAMLNMGTIPTPETVADNNAEFSFCPECGRRIVAGSKFCPECGSRLISAQQEVGETQEQEEEAQGQEVRTKTLYISVGGHRGQMLRFHRLSPEDDLYEQAQELIADGDQSAIEDFIENFDIEDFEYDIQPLNDSGMTCVQVTDEDGNEIFSDEVEVDQRRFNGNPHNWKFDESVSETMVSSIKLLVEERYDEAYANYIEDTDNSDEEQCRNEFWEEECDLADEITTEMLTDVLKINSEKDSDDIYYVWGGDLYGFSYEGEIQIPEDEEFDVDMLRLFLSDYDGYGVNFNESDCWDSVLPVIQYGNTFSQLYIGDWEIHYQNAAFCSVKYYDDTPYLNFIEEE